MQTEYVHLSPPLRQEVDLLITRLEYLAKVRRARHEAQRAIEQQCNTEITTEELDRLLSTGELPS